MRRLISTLSLATAFALGCAAQTNAYAADAASGGATADSNQPVTDTWITTKVKSELATTDGVKSGDISIKTVDGTVTLTGVLASRIEVKKAVAVTRAVKGVKHVDASGLKAKA